MIMFQPIPEIPVGLVDDPYFQRGFLHDDLDLDLVDQVFLVDVNGRQAGYILCQIPCDEYICPHIWLDREFVRQGRNIARAFIGYMFGTRLSLNYIFACVISRNRSALNYVRKIGFKPYKVLPAACSRDGISEDLHVFSISRGERWAA